ncbi:Flavin-containing monooxygenase FMO GS-OX-like 9 [Cocos nucifera]|uniref:Flavin-containing monooxygenase n=1 Tax=Cocos nucifera TaxID=13894 RepID=A0A8K0IDF1_COCNU|nr:Flavin-containing monooxygenase FMO GS-OX-like 9 [Cocos nucifera]
MTPEIKQSKYVCVLGAGPSGLVAARELRREGHSVVVLEQNHDVGGQWLYDPRVEEEDALGRVAPLKVHSSAYASLRVMSPRLSMGFTDFPFLARKGRDMRAFPGHREIYLYLRDFCDWFGLRELIRFNTRAENVAMVGSGESGNNIKWVVRSKEKKCEKVMEESFDAVVVATGHYSQPSMPNIKGMDVWTKKQIHSHVYRVPEPYCDEIDSLCEDGRVLFVDGSSITADSIIYCTGYSYSFPFLDTEGIVVVDDNRVGPLYEHTFPPLLAPSLSFVGIPKKILGFPFFESQAKWIAQLLSGKRTLPSPDDMMKAIKDFYRTKEIKGIPKRKTHEIASFEYCDMYGDNCGFPHLEEWKKEICLLALKNSLMNLETYRDQWDDDEWLRMAY